MYFQIIPPSPLYQQLSAMRKRMEHAKQQTKEFVREFSVGKCLYMDIPNMAAGGVQGLYFSPYEVPEGWVRIPGAKFKGVYRPRRTKENSVLADRMAALPTVSLDELNRLIRFQWGIYGDYVIRSAGFQFLPDAILVKVSDYVEDYQPVEGMHEITYTAHKELLGTALGAVITSGVALAVE